MAGQFTESTATIDVSTCEESSLALVAPYSILLSNISVTVASYLAANLMSHSLYMSASTLLHQ